MESEITIEQSSFRIGVSASGDKGWTVLELLVTIGVIALLSTLLLPALSRGKSSAQQTKCLSNLRQMGVSSLLYAEDDSRGKMTGQEENGVADLSYLYPHYLSDLTVFACPSTKDLIRTNEVFNPYTGRSEVIDLHYHTHSVVSLLYGHSYDVYGFMNANASQSTEVSIRGVPTEIPFKRKTLQSVQSHVRSHGDTGRAMSSSDLWLLLDRNADVNLDFPDKGDAHGASGGNVFFCDGHAGWVTQSRYLAEYELSQDDGRTNISFGGLQSSGHPH